MENEASPVPSADPAPDQLGLSDADLRELLTPLDQQIMMLTQVRAAIASHRDVNDRIEALRTQKDELQRVNDELQASAKQLEEAANADRVRTRDALEESAAKAKAELNALTNQGAELRKKNADQAKTLDEMTTRFTQKRNELEERFATRESEINERLAQLTAKLKQNEPDADGANENALR